jgi:hypothetical protein
MPALFDTERAFHQPSARELLALCNDISESMLFGVRDR